MHVTRLFFIIAFILSGCGPAFAVEGPTAAGPIGGTDIRSAVLPPPGLYGGVIVAGAEAFNFVDGHGDTIPALKDANLWKILAGPWLYGVSDFKVLGGHFGLGGIVPIGNQCGHLFIGQADDCTSGVGDPYVEIDWSRSFGKLRPSKFPGALPILQGLSILVGFGVVLPGEAYDSSDPLQQALSIANNTWDFAPTMGLTYTSPPILADGTEISVRFFWNNYLKNPATDYSAGDLLDFEFALTERIGRFQVGVAGFYAFQVEDDELFGVRVPPDGRRVKNFQLGPILNYDLPERMASVKVKAITTFVTENTVESWAVVAGWAKKF